MCKVSVLSLLSSLFFLSACAADDPAAKLGGKPEGDIPAQEETAGKNPADGREAAEICPQTRPQICTREYRPVCASLQDGGEKTYSNACSACADVQVLSYVPQACAASR